MFKNVFVGENAAKQPVKVLILGESHYEHNGKIDCTDGVVKHLAIDGNDQKTQFYKNILRTFNYDITPEQRKLFWNKVYCGNYVSKLCDTRKNNIARDLIKDNKKIYNDELFDFINKNRIDVVLCFSRLVYNNLPSAADGEKDEIIIKHKTNYLKKIEYHANIEHKICSVTLIKPLTVYGLKHPSSGFSASVYCDYFKNTKINFL